VQTRRVYDNQPTRGEPVDLDIRLLGHFEVRAGGEALSPGGRRQRAVLAILAMAANEQVSADALIDRLWAGEPPPSAASGHVVVRGAGRLRLWFSRNTRSAAFCVRASASS
jgi:DNA-binding winged helix-turn-helix (wHTH) protein